MSQLPATQPVSVRREYPDAPLVGVAAAVFNREGRVLLVKRGRPPGVGNWGLPGGLLDLGESLEAGVHREVQEECGVEIEIGGLIGLFQPVERDDDGRIRYHYVVVDYWASHVRGIPTPEDDAADAAWVDLSDMDRLPMNPETRRVVREAQGLWTHR